MWAVYFTVILGTSRGVGTHMQTNENLEEAIEVLQQLGLKEYEARCFAGLSRLPTATAKQISEMTEVPRTRVYDAVRMLEAQGLVEIHHSSPQQFRAVPLDEATETLRDQYENRIDRLNDALETVEIVETEDESPVQQVWAMSGRDAIENRTNQLIAEAEEEIVLVLGDDSLLTESLIEDLNEIANGVNLIIGALTESLQDQIQEAIPSATTFVSGLEWLRGDDTDADVAMGRLLLVDRSTFLVSSLMMDSRREQAVFGEGFGNGLVILARRLMAQGLLIARDPGQ